MTVNGTLTLTDGLVNTGTIDARGDIVQASTFDGGSAILNFANDSLAQTYTINGGVGPHLRFDSAADADDAVIFTAAATLNGLQIAEGFGNHPVPITYNDFPITIGTFTQASGIFTAPATLTLSGHFTRTGGTFTEGTGTVTFTGTSATYNVPTTHAFHHVTIHKTNGHTLTITTGQTMTVNGTLTLTDGLVNTGTIDARGDIVQASTFDGGTAILNFANDSLAQTYTINGGTGPHLRFDSAADAADQVVFQAAGALHGLTIAVGFGAQPVPLVFNGYNLTLGNGGFTQADGIFTAPATLSISGNFTRTGGTFDAGTGTVVFSAGNTNYHVIGESQIFHNVIFDKTYSFNSLQITAGQTMIVNGTLTLTRGGINTGTIDARGDVILASTFGGGTAPLIFSGSAPQIFTTNNASTFKADIIIHKSGGQVNLVGNLIMNGNNQDLIIQQGTLDLNGSNLTVTGGTNQTMIVQDGGTLRLQGNETISTSATYPQLQVGSTVYYDGTNGPYTIKDYM
jgi:hypothetical protein